MRRDGWMRGGVGLAAATAMIGALVATGCRNSCQQICSRMADYAREECSFEVSDAEMDECVERQGSGLDAEDRQACREFGDAEVIQSQWTCEDLAVYWSGSAA